MKSLVYCVYTRSAAEAISEGRGFNITALTANSEQISWRLAGGLEKSSAVTGGMQTRSSDTDAWDSLSSYEFAPPRLHPSMALAAISAQRFVCVTSKASRHGGVSRAGGTLGRSCWWWFVSAGGPWLGHAGICREAHRLLVACLKMFLKDFSGITHYGEKLNQPSQSKGTRRAHKC